MRNTIQQFHIAPSPYLFLDSSNRIFYVAEGVRAAQADLLGLKPLLLYGLAWDKGAGGSIKVSVMNNPCSLRRFLYDNWKILNEEGCLPRGIKIGERYLDNIPWLHGFAKSFGIEVLRTSTSDIPYRSVMRALQAQAVGEFNYSKTIASFNAAAIHSFFSEIPALHARDRIEESFLPHSCKIPTVKAFSRGDVIPGQWLMQNQARILKVWDLRHGRDSAASDTTKIR